MGLPTDVEVPPVALVLIATIAFQTGEAPLEVEVAFVVAVAAEGRVLMVPMTAGFPHTTKVHLKAMWEVTVATSQVLLKNPTTTVASMGACKANTFRRQMPAGSMKDTETMKVRSRVS